MMLSQLEEEERSGSMIEEFAISQITNRNLDYYENNKEFLAQTLHPDEADSPLNVEDTQSKEYK